MLATEERVLAWVRDFEGRTGAAPTAAEVAAGMGLMNEGTARIFLLSLVRQGHIEPPRFATVKTREDLP
jgi:hypothetical protein